ncbi:alpha/beta hydrolase [Streptomyces spectabilis]|uniref:Alpha/beta hydrolase n=1 Tax=Streptomyces spectabilis TaxID=68270 RepID=A0A516RB49_STRST|nr:alpha/beta hydrolase [Streptomyces spectabilis]QDQ12863.1 alpha/beta hydrolase [Streptomyces spectabilis]
MGTTSRARRPRPPGRPRTPRPRRVALALLAAALLIPGCSSGGSGDPTANVALAALPRATPKQLASYYDQKPRWRACGVPDFECATLRVPRDYAAPGAGDLRLALSRKRATGKAADRLGSLLVNPGGPGGSAIDYLQSYAALGYPGKVRARYDMVAVDPRGVARSEPVTCLNDRQMDTYTQTDVTPDDAAETARLATSYRKFTAGCEQRAGGLLKHVSTVEAARDMDVVRAALGDSKLTYVGASYGTFLGATYAGLFPDRVGRLVLDGAMDPSLSARRMNEDQTAGFETAFQSFAKDCVRRAGCPLGRKSPADAGRRLKAFFADLDRSPLPAGDPGPAGGRALGEALATTGVIAAMYDESAWPQLSDALDAAMRDRDGSALLALSDSYYERDGDGAYSNLMYANAAVNCLDLPPSFGSPDDVKAALPAFRKASPVFGEGLAWSALNCAYWPVKATGEPHRIEAKGAAPILVAGTTRDPATPYRWAKALASQLSSGRLLTYEGDGHTAYGRGSRCVDDTINTYLLRGRAPRTTKRCA